MDEDSADKAEVQVNYPKPHIDIDPSSSKSKQEPKPKAKTSLGQLETKKDESQHHPAQMLKDTFEPLDTKSKAPANPHQQRVMVFGLLLIGFGFIVWLLISFTVGLSVAAAGALVIAYGAFVRL